jgi:hypothetical protein
MSPPSAPADLSALSFVLRERPGADKADDSLVLVEPFSVPMPGGATASMAPAWFDLVGDLQLRLVRDADDSMLTLHASELEELRLAPEEAVAAALANFRRRHGPPSVCAWHNLQRVGGAEEDFDSGWFADRGFWCARLAEHPAGVVVAAPRTDLLVFAPAADTAAVDSMRHGIPGLHAGAGDWRLSSTLYLFKDGRWTVLQPAVPADAG